MFGDDLIGKQNKLSFFKFQLRFASKQACESYLFSMKWPDNFVCPKCGGTAFYTTRIRNLPLYACRQCGHQTTVTVGTVMEKTRTDLRKWFWAIYMIAEVKRGLSAVMLALQIGVTYKTVWLMLHKIRQAMAQRDARYRLAGLVEMDNAFFGAPTEAVNEDAVRKIGKSQVETARLGLGTNKVGGHNLFAGLSESDGREAVRAALESGIQLLDTAFMYGKGRS